MLMITRRAGERIVLGDDVVLTVMEIRGQTVRIGIDAPRSLPVYREEIWAEVKRENEAAAEAAGARPAPGRRHDTGEHGQEALARSIHGPRPLLGRCRDAPGGSCMMVGVNPINPLGHTVRAADHRGLSPE